jgi:hypothetical protein
MSTSLPPRSPWLNERTGPDEPAPWLHPHPSKQGLHRYYGLVRRRAPHRYSVPSVAASTRSLSSAGRLYEPKCTAVGIDARLLRFRAGAAAQTHAAYTPGTTWPVIGHPPGSSRETSQAPRFRCHYWNHDASTATASGFPPVALVRLPGPHLTHLVRRFPDAQHDGLQPTHLRVVWHLPPKTGAGGSCLRHLLSTALGELPQGKWTRC